MVLYWSNEATAEIFGNPHKWFVSVIDFEWNYRERIVNEQVRSYNFWLGADAPKPIETGDQFSVP